MLREKRIIKKTNSFLHLYKAPKLKSDKSSTNKRKSKRCQFKMIPTPSKVEYDFQILQLYGDIVLIERDGNISSDISLLSKFFLFRSVQVDKFFETKLIKATLEHKYSFKFTAWDKIVQRLESSSIPELNKWGFIIKNFSSKYEDLIRQLEKKKNKALGDKQEERDHIQITENTEEKKLYLLKNFPCFYFKFRFEGEGVRLKEIIFNNSFLGFLGYSPDIFAFFVLQEGLPQFLSNDSEFLSIMFKTLMENYFILGKEGLATPCFDVSLLLKNNYVRDAQVQINLFMNYEGDSFGIDVITAVIRKEEPYMDQSILPRIQLSKRFMREMIKNEQNQAEFLSIYYSIPFTYRYIDCKKICMIKEIPFQKEESDDSSV